MLRSDTAISAVPLSFLGGCLLQTSLRLQQSHACFGRQEVELLILGLPETDHRQAEEPEDCARQGIQNTVRQLSERYVSLLTSPQKLRDTDQLQLFSDKQFISLQNLFICK